MKTNHFSLQKTSLYSLIGFLSLLFASCGSYQNSSYYDSDGIYGAAGTKTNGKTTQNNQYSEYFNSLQNSNQSTGIFTDVNNHGNYDTATDSISTGYPAWGSNYQ